MAGNRWQNLDFDTPARSETPQGGATFHTADPARTPARADDPVLGSGHEPQSPLSPAGRRCAPEFLDDTMPPVVKQATGAYLLRSYQAVVELLEPRLRDQPDLPGGMRTLGMALARLNREGEAISCFREAVRRREGDWLARAALASLLLRQPEVRVEEADHPGSISGALAHLEAAWAVQPRPALRELLGAACWLHGQEALGHGQHEDAVRRFSRAGAEFAAAAEESGAARHDLPMRQTAAFIGEAIALLSGGRIAAAQRLFSRAPVWGIRARDPLSRFAAGLYELCEALVPASPAERLESAGALRAVVLAVRLRVGFYDGRQAVSLTWTGEWDENG